jgi:hypothetical protein
MLGLKKSALPAVFGSYFEGNEDLKSEQVSLKVAGDFSVTEWKASMKRVGPSPIMGTQGIGSTIHMVGVALQTFKDGKIFKEVSLRALVLARSDCSSSDRLLAVLRQVVGLEHWFSSSYQVAALPE